MKGKSLSPDPQSHPPEIPLLSSTVAFKKFFMYMLLSSYKYLKYFLLDISFSTVKLEGDEENSTMFIDLKIF